MLQALGKLAVISAQSEEILHELYWKYANLNDKSGPVVTDNLNPKRLSEDILKFAALDKSKAHILADLTILFSEFQTLNTKRNHCLHWIWEAKFGDKPGILNMPENPEPYQVKRPIYRQSGILAQEFTAKDITEICNDFGWLLRRLESHKFTESTLRAMRISMDGFGGIIEADGSIRPSGLADLFYPAPWLDKQPQPDSTPSDRLDAQK